MQQLSGTDNVMLIGERRNIYNHVASLIIYDVSTAPGGKVRFKDILQHYEQRLYLHPVFRRRLATVPFGLDRPYWITETDIDVEYHIRHIALPKPGDWRQLMIQVARLHSRPLDRSRPLWEAYVIEGLDNIPEAAAGRVRHLPEDPPRHRGRHGRGAPHATTARGHPGAGRGRRIVTRGGRRSRALALRVHLARPGQPGRAHDQGTAHVGRDRGPHAGDSASSNCRRSPKATSPG